MIKKIAVLSAVVLVPTLFADDLAFWGTGTSDATNVVSTVSQSTSSSLDLHFYWECVSDGFTYSTRPKGAMLIIR